MYDKDALDFGKILQFVEDVPANIFFKDTECKYRFVTKVCSSLNGGDEHSIIGKTDLEVQCFEELGRQYYEDDKKILATGKGSEFISSFPLKSGTLYYEIKKNPVFKDGKIIGIVGVVTDITKRTRLEKEFEELAFKDTLTGLRNRNYLEARGKGNIQKEDYPVTLIMADCNLLKKVNDTLGHEYGDRLLTRTARAIEDTLPEGCIAMRLGGDEFLIFCTKCSQDKAQNLIEEIKKCFKERSDDVLTLTAAFGACTIEDDSLPFADALRLADQAMYKDKRKSHEE